MIRRLGATLLAGTAILSGCAIGEESRATNEHAMTADEDLAELRTLLGDDRVGRTISANANAIPDELSRFEHVFKVGRECNRTDSKEVFAVAEKSSRLSGGQEETEALLPRLVISGCNQHPSVPTAMRESFELFVAVVSDKGYPTNDPLSTSPVEAMALDDKTGLYNFYVFEKNTEGADIGTVTRFVRRADDVIEKWVKVAGKPVTREITADRRCFNCHINGSPVMNELTDPWTHWVSSRASYPASLDGTSRSLVSEARPFAGEHGRSSLSNELEKIIRASITTWVEGSSHRPGSGLGAQVMSGAQPGGIGGLLKSVFCDQEVNYATAFDTVPTPLFVDQTVADLAAIEPPLAPHQHDLELIPVRAESDKRIERYLQKARILRPDTVMAARLVDEMHESFSPQRCSLLPGIVSRIDAGEKPDDAVRQAILSSLGGEPGPRAAYMRALLDPATSADDRDGAEAAYIADVTRRVSNDMEKLAFAAGRRELSRRKFARQAAARSLFPDEKNPLPITHAPVGQ